MGIALLAVVAGCADPDHGSGELAGPGAGGKADSQGGVLELVAHSDLGRRGMSSALAVVGDTAYVGSRDDRGGVLVVDIASRPMAVVGEFGGPAVGMTSRELRALPEQDLLFVMQFACGVTAHGCSRDESLPGGVAMTDRFEVYDIGDRRAPALLSYYDFETRDDDGSAPHEFFLWRDPVHAGRVLLYVSVPYGPPYSPRAPLQVLELGADRQLRRIATFTPSGSKTDLLHSIGVTRDGRTAVVSHTEDGMLVLDTSQVAEAVASPVITQTSAGTYFRADTHSAVEIPGRNLWFVTDEVYPGAGSCPWGWSRIVDVTGGEPVVRGEFRVEEQEACADGERFDVTYTAHNATATEHLAFVTWHAAGLQVLDTSDPMAPVRVAEHRPEPLAAVDREDPRLTPASQPAAERVLMWSTPILADGLIYVVDLRNGLYVYRYTGPHEEEATSVVHLEGSSH